MLPAALLDRAARVLEAGGVIAYPTEAVWGLGCDPASVAAVERICRIKQRSLQAGLILIVSDLEQLAGWISPGPAETRRLDAPASRPVTWIVSAGPLVPPWVTGGRDSVAVRCTSHPVAAALCRAWGQPLVSTSANRHGRRPARTALAVRRCFGREVDLVVPGATGGLARPSEIRDARTGECLRPG